MAAIAIEAGRAIVVLLPDDGSELVGVVEAVKVNEVIVVLQSGNQNTLLGAHPRIVRIGIDDPLIVDIPIDRVEPIDDEPPRAILQFEPDLVKVGTRSRARVRAELRLDLLVPDLYRPRTIEARTDWISSSALAVKVLATDMKNVEEGASLVASVQFTDDHADLLVLERGPVEIAGRTARVVFNIVSADNNARNVLQRVVGDALLSSAGLG